jgi:hypothetical protein
VPLLSVVSTVNGLMAARPRIRDSIPDGGRILSLIKIVQMYSGSHQPQFEWVMATLSQEENVAGACS